VEIEVFSDVVCPWCYLGARRLGLALDELDRTGVVDRSTVRVRWRAFQLDPSAPPEAQDLRTAIDRKYGPGAFDGTIRRLTPLGSEVGIDYRFDLARRVNTLDAHRLMAWAATQPPGQDALAEGLFEAYFTRGDDVSDHSTLVRIAGDAGLEADAAAELLAGDGGTDAVLADRAEAERLDVTGVPTFRVDGAAIIPGAQDVETVVRVLARQAERSRR